MALILANHAGAGDWDHYMARVRHSRPARAGVIGNPFSTSESKWIPAFAGKTRTQGREVQGGKPSRRRFLQPHERVFAHARPRAATRTRRRVTTKWLTCGGRPYKVRHPLRFLVPASSAVVGV